MGKKEKLKFALYWAASCGGREIAVLDINRSIEQVYTVGKFVHTVRYANGTIGRCAK